MSKHVLADTAPNRIQIPIESCMQTRSYAKQMMIAFKFCVRFMCEGFLQSHVFIGSLYCEASIKNLSSD